MLPTVDARRASLMLCMAAIVVFSDQGALLGPLLVGMCGGLYCPTSRRASGARSSSTAQLRLSRCSPPRRSSTRSRRPARSDPRAAARSSRSRRRSLRARELHAPRRSPSWSGPAARRPPGRRSGRCHRSQMYPFALLGVFLGASTSTTAPVLVPLFVVPILVARQTFASYLALKESQEAAVRTLIGALEAKDPYTAGHAERVAGYAEYIGAGARDVAVAARAAALRRAHARRRQARRPEPPAQQAGQAHRGGVRAGAHARRGVGRDPHAHRLPRARSRRARRAKPRSSRRSRTTAVSRSSRTSWWSPTRTTR